MNLKEVTLKTEPENSKKEKETFSTTLAAFFSIIGIIIFVVVLISFLDSNAEKNEAKELEKIGIISNSFKNIYDSYNSKTSLQKSAYWDSIKGKKVQWSGSVDEVRGAFLNSSLNVIVVKTDAGRFKVDFPSSTDLSSVDKGSSITIRGTLSDRWELRDAEIIKK